MPVSCNKTPSNSKTGGCPYVEGGLIEAPQVRIDGLVPPGHRQTLPESGIWFSSRRLPAFTLVPLAVKS